MLKFNTLIDALNNKNINYKISRVFYLHYLIIITVGNTTLFFYFFQYTPTQYIYQFPSYLKNPKNNYAIFSNKYLILTNHLLNISLYFKISKNIFLNIFFHCNLKP